jgi:hypothetical protein
MGIALFSLAGKFEHGFFFLVNHLTPSGDLIQMAKTTQTDILVVETTIADTGAF